MEVIDATIKIYDNFIEIIPKAGVSNNSVYEIQIKGCKAINENKAIDTLDLKVCTALTPAYCSLEAVATLVDYFGVPDDRILYYIREASRYVDFISVIDPVGEPSFEVVQYVKYKTALDVILKAYIEKAAEAGTKGTLGNISFENSDSLPGIKSLLEMLRQEVKKWEDAVLGYKHTGPPKPLSTTKGVKAAQNIIKSPTIDQIISDLSRNRGINT